MSVSSPSYFPPAAANGAVIGATAGGGTVPQGARVFLEGFTTGKNSTPADLILVGDSSATAGWTDAGLRGSVLIGSGSLPQGCDATTDVLAGAGGVGAVTIIGWNNFPAVVAGSRLAGTMAIGANIATSFPAAGGSSNFARNLFIGNSVWNNNTAGNGFGSSDNIIIGYTAGSRGAAGNSQWLHNIVIGSQAGIFSGSSLADNVIIGYQACNAMANTPAQNVVIGASAGQSLTNTSSNTLVGYGVNIQNPANGQNVLVGAQSSLLAGDRNTLVGVLQTWCGNGSNNIGLGSRQVGSVIPVNPSNRVVIESQGQTFVYGDLAAGNFVIGGQPSTAAQRTIPDAPNGAFNTLGLVNGVKSATNPSAGGYFYVTAGALHWVGSAGTDTPLAVA